MAEAEKRISETFGVSMNVPADLVAWKQAEKFLWFSTNATEGVRCICLYTIRPGGDFAAMRDSVMQVRDSLCMVEKDSLRKAVVVEEAKCANWEQSYQTVKKDNEVCAQALGVAIEVNEKNKNAADEERKKAAMTTGSSFLGGLGIGLLIMWLIMK